MSILIFVDVEASGKTPMTGKLVQIGAVSENGDEFFAELWPNIPHPDIPALPVISDKAQPYEPLQKVAERFRDWLLSLDERVILVSDNNGFDAMWISCFFDENGIDNPFGHSSRRIGDYYSGLKGNYRNVNGWKKYRKTPHTHNALDDAKGNREAWLTINEKFV